MLWASGTISPGYHRYFNTETGEFRITDVPPGLYDMEVQSASPDLTLKPVRLERLEIKKGQMYGELLINLPAMNNDQF